VKRGYLAQHASSVRDQGGATSKGSTQNHIRFCESNNERTSFFYFTYSRSQRKSKTLHLNGSAEPISIPYINLDLCIEGLGLLFHIVLVVKGRLERST
jgi:hypothetical protein